MIERSSGQSDQGSPPAHELVAIIGVGGVFPGAPDANRFWDNILAGRNSIREIPADRLDPQSFFDLDPDAVDGTTCRVAGVVEDIGFQAKAFRIPPLMARSMDRVHKMALVAASEAMRDAGYHDRDYDRDRAAVILGHAGQTEKVAEVNRRVQQHLVDAELRRALTETGVANDRIELVVERTRGWLLGGTHPVTEDSLAGCLPNVAAARVASCFGMRGPSYVVDAACASSLAAIECAVAGLLAGEFDLAIAGGVHGEIGPTIQVGFSKFRGLSRTGVRPFDAAADGFVAGEGAGVFVLKRLDDALRDADRVLAVVRGIGSSSDGRETGIAAPNARAQAMAMSRALDAAGYGAACLQLVETHGAGTPVGDPIELAAMGEAFVPNLEPGQRLLITAVKSQIGHLMGASGAAGLMKVVLGLKHRTLPPTINHSIPNPAVNWAELPLDVVTATAPWPANRHGLPRRAGVSSFGFGGVNYHLTLEEYDPRYHGEASDRPTPRTKPMTMAEPIAVIGLAGSIAPGGDAEQFWTRVLTGESAIEPAPETRFEGRTSLFMDSDPTAVDKTYGVLGAFVEYPDFDGRPFRLPPITAARLDPQQQLTLKLADAATRDAGYHDRPFDRRRTAVVLGDSLGCQHTLWATLLRLSARRVAAALRESGAMEAAGIDASVRATVVQRVTSLLRADRPAVTEDSILASCPQIGAARYAKAADLMGPNMTVDAACASALAAVGVAAQGLRSGRWDMVVAGGSATEITPCTAVLFAKASALSATGCQPLSDRADGMVQGEGGAIFVLKRLRDALADGDRVRAVIRGIGLSTDGGTRAMFAPDPSGQRLALERAYADAGYQPGSVDLVECHATGTPIGDAAEIESLGAVFGERSAEHPLALSAVKSLIGHLGPGAGAAGLLKTIFALELGILPPTTAAANPHPTIAGSRDFTMAAKPRAWPVSGSDRPRRAGVSAFGFGGSNAHVTLEAFDPVYHRQLVGVESPISEALLVLGGASLDEAIVAGTAVRDDLAAGRPLADTVRAATRHGRAQAVRVAFGVGSAPELESKLGLVRKVLAAGGRPGSLEARAIYISGSEPAPDLNGRVAFLFPGQGSHYADMLRGFCEEYSVVRQTVAEANEVLKPLLGRTFQQIAFRNGDEDLAAVEERLLDSEVVQPALLVTNVALHRLLEWMGLRPDVVAGHSLGEYAALVAAGTLTFADAIRFVHARGRAMGNLANRGDPGQMAMVSAGADRVRRSLTGIAGYVAIANLNCLTQTIVAGEGPAVAEAVALFANDGIECQLLPIAGAFHSRLASALRPAMDQALAHAVVGRPALPILSSVTADYYPASADAGQVRAALLDQLDHPVDFVAMVDRLYADGVRTFVEVGPKRALTGFVGDILAGRPHTALHAAHPKLGELAQFNRLLAALIARGWALDPEGRDRPAAPEQPAPRPQLAQVEEPPPAPRAGPAPTARAGQPTGPRPPIADDAIVVSGLGLGLPGLAFPVFDDRGFARILGGQTLIDPLSGPDQDRIVEQNVVRLVKGSNDSTGFEAVADRSGAVKLAGQRGQFDLARDFGITDEHILTSEPAFQLAVAAGLEGLRDAGIPLQRRYRDTTTGGTIRDGWSLPASYQGDTAVVFATAFGGHTTLAGEIERFGAHKYGTLAADGLRSRYQDRLSAAATAEERLAADRWFAGEQHRLWNGGDPAEGYRFDSHFLTKLVCMSNVLFARLVRARGPNFQINAACSSTTVALAVAADMIRSGRAARAVVLAADDVTSGPMLEWVAAGFLAAGASATDASVVDAAIPFDRRRHGMVLGMGAVCLVLERQRDVRARGVASIGELLATRLSNSAGHFTRPDSDFIRGELDALLGQAERTHGLDRQAIAAETLYLSHETFTPARGGIAETEAAALRHTFGEAWRDVTIVNTKAMTGHAQAAGIEDVVALLALQHRQLPPVINHREPDPALEGLRLSPGGATDAEFALRFSAGFGGQVASSLVRRGTRTGAAVVDPARYARWLAEATGVPGAEVEVHQRTLRLREAAHSAPTPTPPLHVPPPPAPPVTESVPARAIPPVGGPNRDALTEAVLAEIEAKTGYERELLELDLDLEADLGIDTIKQAQIMVSLRERYQLTADTEFRLQETRTLRLVIDYLARRLSGAPEGEPAPVAAAGTAEIEATVLGIVSEKTGYEPELLELDLDLEADLGIDTIKQAQIMVSLRERYGLTADTEFRLQETRTLRLVIDYLDRRLLGARAPEPAPIPTTPPTPPQPASPPAPAEAAAVAGMAEIEAAVLGIVSEKTGYEPELLELDLDLEADLGIDTIKQAQIMVSLRERYGLAADTEFRLQDTRTLRLVIEYLSSRVSGTTAPEPLVAAPAPDNSGGPRPYRRLTPVAAEEALNGLRPGPRFGPGSGVIITNDGLGLAPVLAAALVQRGARVALLNGNGHRLPEVFTYDCRLDRPDEIRRAVAEAQRDIGAIDGFFHLATLAPTTLDLTANEWPGALAVSVKSAFHLVKALHGNLQKGVITAVTGLGGQLGFQKIEAHPDFPGVAVAGMSGGVAGLFKTVAREFPDAAVQVVDFAPEEVTAHPAAIVARLLDELDHGPPPMEVGYRSGQRFVVKLVESPVESGPGRPPQISGDTVLLIVGGGRGLGGTIARDLAARYRPTIVLVGRSPLPVEGQRVAAFDDEQRRQWRRDYHRARRAERPDVRPAEVERELERLEAGAETWRTLRDLEAAGSRADYRACDVRDPGAVSDLVVAVQAQYGRIHVVVFGAGVIEDRTIEAKDPASFDRVFDVKGLGYYNLWQAFRREPPDVLVAFSSVAGRFGNRGQVDYAAANDLVSRMTAAIDRTTPGLRAVAIDWTAWADVGLAARSGVGALLEQAGLELLAPAEGARAFHDELQHGVETEVCIMGNLGSLEPDRRPDTGPPPTVPAPTFLDRIDLLMPGSEVRATCHLDLERDEWLRDHVIDGTPLLPGVMGVELMAQAASLLFPGMHFVGVDDLDIALAVKIFPAHPLDVQISGRVLDDPDGGEQRVAVRITSDFESPNGKVRVRDRLHYTATIHLSPNQPRPPVSADDPAAPCDAIVGRDSLYGSIGVLPHGPVFRVLDEVRFVDDRSSGRLASLSEDRLTAARGGGELLTAPLACEAAFQAAGLFGLLRLNRQGLPGGYRRMRSFSRPDSLEKLHAFARPRAGAPMGSPEFDVEVTGPGGRVYQRIEGFRLVGLNDFEGES